MKRNELVLSYDNFCLIFVLNKFEINFVPDIRFELIEITSWKARAYGISHELVKYLKLNE